jgi:BirA family transcriptional regulator, biotin operon repressor / biotin---[acetyl-CoA-carboxylase] ligase
MISPDEVWELLNRHIGRRVFCFESASSTNDLASEFGNDPSQTGNAVLAARQTAGRGQYGRIWQAPAGSSVLLSISLQPPAECRSPAVLTAWAAVSICELVANVTGEQARIKWPNDVLVRERKICGVLIEQSRSIVAGIGLNVNQSTVEFEAAGLPLATSLATIAGRNFDSKEIAKSLLAELDSTYDRLVTGDMASVESQWASRLGLVGHEVLAETFDGVVHRGRLRECGFAGLDLESRSGQVELHLPEQIKALVLA